jgi:transcriptional regulator with XRE-family HTH domain
VDDDLVRAVAGALILDARGRAGLTQAELAVRAGTAQSAIAGYEAGDRQPTLPTLYRILAAAGFDLRARLEPHDPHDETVTAWEAAQPAPQRLRRREQLTSSRQAASSWQAGLR